MGYYRVFSKYIKNVNTVDFSGSNTDGSFTMGVLNLFLSP